MTRRTSSAAGRHGRCPGAAALLGLVLALAAGAAMACTPPRPFDIALGLAATVEAGGAVQPGSTGRLVFTAFNYRPGFGPEGFEVRQAAFDPSDPQGPPIRLRSASGSDCVVEDRQTNSNGQPSHFQAVVAPRDRHRPWPRTCHVDYEVPADAAAGQAVRYTLVLQDFCGIDVDTSNNSADLPFGVIPPPPAAPARPAPLAAWPLALLVLAMLAVARLVMPRLRSGPVAAKR